MGLEVIGKRSTIIRSTQGLVSGDLNWAEFIPGLKGRYKTDSRIHCLG